MKSTMIGTRCHIVAQVAINTTPPAQLATEASIKSSLSIRILPRWFEVTLNLRFSPSAEPVAARREDESDGGLGRHQRRRQHRPELVVAIYRAQVVENALQDCHTSDQGGGRLTGNEQQKGRNSPSLPEALDVPERECTLNEEGKCDEEDD